MPSTLPAESRRQPIPFSTPMRIATRLRLRARLGVKAELSDHVEAVVRLSSGSLTNVAGSENQTLGTYGNRYTVGIDQAYILWNTNTHDQLSANTLEGGRLGNPWFAPTELVYARDLTFEGVADTMRLGWGEGAADRSHVFLTIGAFPMLEVPTQAENDKWNWAHSLAPIYASARTITCAPRWRTTIS